MAQQTKNAIRRALIQLLHERPLDKISIKDIAEKGAVNRNTFYYYYADIYALVEDILQLEIQDFQSKLRRYDSWQEAFRDATAFASQNKRAVYHLYNSGNQETLRRYYHKVTLAAMTSYIRDQAEGLPADDEDIRVLSEFYAAALSGLTARWLQNGMKYDTDAYIDHLGHLLDGNIRRALELSPYFTEAEYNLQFIERKEGAILPANTTENQWLTYIRHETLGPISILSGAVMLTFLALLTVTRRHGALLTILATLSGLVTVAAVMNYIMYPETPESIPTDR